MPPKFIFIIPYKNRLPQLTFFSKYIKYIMEDYSDDEYEFYFSHQCCYNIFNRGGVKNIGFLV